MNTRTIYYIDPDEDPLDIEVKRALSRTMEENLKAYCAHVAAIYAMRGIDIMTYPVKRKIYYLEDE